MHTALSYIKHSQLLIVQSYYLVHGGLCDQSWCQYICVSINVCINDINFFLLSSEQGIFVVTNYFSKINSTSVNSSFLPCLVICHFWPFTYFNDYNKSFQNNLADFNSCKEKTSVIW